MDSRPVPPPAAFGPDRRYTALAAAGAVVAVVVAVLTDDREGRLLASAAAALLVLLTASDLVFAPRLRVDGGGLTVDSPLCRAQLGWSELERVQVVTRSRLGLRSSALELDAGEVLVELTARTLGRPLDQVLAAIDARRPAT